MKEWIWTCGAFLTFFALPWAGEQTTAQAKEIEVELVGKLGGMSNFIEKESLGDSEFSIAGGLGLTALFRFDAGFGVGLNFNWTMSEQRLDLSKLTYSLEARDRWMTIHHPSFGLSLRYSISDMFDWGLRLNYGFGTVKTEMDIAGQLVANAFNLTGANLCWDLQTFDIALMGAFTWEIPETDLSIVIGLEFYAEFSRMYADDHSLEYARDLHGRRLDENSINSLGFNVLFGLRYDWYIDGKKN